MLSRSYSQLPELESVREQSEIRLAKLSLVVQATKIGLWDMEVVKGDPVNPTNTFIWSDEFRQLLGFSNETDFPNALGSWSDRLHPDDKNRTLAAFASHILDTTGKTPYDIEYRLLKKNGEYGYFRASGETIRDENGTPLNAVGALIDITETKNTLFNIEKQRIAAEAANQAKSYFLSIMSHEIRTPMNAILGLTEVQLRSETLDKSIRGVFEKIYVSGDLLLKIINDILDLSKIEAGKLQLIPVAYEVASLISDTAQVNIMRIGSKPIQFTLHIDENLPALLFGDQLRIKQILNNLLSNAFKYTKEGTVTLSISAEPGDKEDEARLILIVSDTGPGMTKEQLARLFDRYSQFNLEANRTIEGTGLGMAITRSLVHLMTGEISVESEPGRGSTVTVRLPQGKISSGLLGRETVEYLCSFRTADRTLMKMTELVHEPMPYGSVLIVDDVEMNICVAQALMDPYGLKIDSADSGLAAIEKIRAGNVYDIVFMDHMMPKMDGIEATKLIRAMGYGHPIVALTANAVVGQAKVFLANGFDDFISKPIDVHQMDRLLNRLIRDKQQPEVIAAARRQADINHRRSSESALQSTGDLRFAEIFVRDASKSIAALDAILEKRGPYDDDALRMYVIHVHGMKSALANIGKMDLSAVANRLEVLGRNGDARAMASETPGFLFSLRALVEKLRPQEKNEDSGPVAEALLPYLREKLLVVKAACEEYDEKTADDAIAELREKTWPRPTGELLRTIAEHLLHSDFDEIADAVDKFMAARS